MNSSMLMIGGFGFVILAVIVIGILFATGVFGGDESPSGTDPSDTPSSDTPSSDTPPSDSMYYNDNTQIPMETDNFSFEPFELSGTEDATGEWCENKLGNNLGGTNLNRVNPLWRGAKDCDKWVTQTHPSATHFSYDTKTNWCTAYTDCDHVEHRTGDHYGIVYSK